VLKAAGSTASRRQAALEEFNLANLCRRCQKRIAAIVLLAGEVNVAVSNGLVRLITGATFRGWLTITLAALEIVAAPELSVLCGEVVASGRHTRPIERVGTAGDHAQKRRFLKELNFEDRAVAVGGVGEDS